MASALGLGWVLAASPLAATPPPPNDLCAGAIVLPSAGPFPYFSPIIADVRSATTNQDPVPPCVFNIVSNGVWYAFSPSVSAQYTFSVSYDTASTVADTAIAVYTSAGGCAGPFTAIECNDDQSSLQAALTVTLHPGTNYYLVVSTLFPFDFSSGTALQLKLTKPVTPPNDTCAGAELIPSGPLPQLSTTSDITKATTTGDPPLPTCATSGEHSVWFRFIPTNSGVFVFSTDDSTATTVYDTLMALYSASGNCVGLTEAACNDQFDAPATIIASNLTVGGTYYIVVWDADPFSPTPGETSVQLRIARQRRPAVTTLPASSVASTSALLNASVNANYVSTRLWFEWGLTTNYGNTSISRSIGKGGGDVVTNILVTGLTPGALYHFRAVAGNSLGTNYGDDRVLSWLNTRPQVTAWGYEADGSYRLRFTAPSGQAYRVEGARDLPAWVDLGTARDLGNGLYEFVDANAGRYAHRFYRVKGP